MEETAIFLMSEGNESRHFDNRQQMGLQAKQKFRNFPRACSRVSADAANL